MGYYVPRMHHTMCSPPIVDGNLANVFQVYYINRPKLPVKLHFHQFEYEELAYFYIFYISLGSYALDIADCACRLYHM